MKREKVIVVVGPTCSGKTSLAIKLAKKYNGEVISADSRQVYRGLNLGTGKVTKKEMRGIPHHLLDVLSPKKVFTAHDFVVQGRECIDDILRRGKVPVIAGGTGFYIDALLGIITFSEAPINPELRARLETKNAATLFSMLKKSDPTRAQQMDTSSERNNKHRLIRALEVASAKKQGFFKMDNGYQLPCSIEWIGISTPLSVLESKIQKRLAARMKAGMLRETKKLHKNGLSFKRMESIGLEYRYLARLLQNKITRTEFNEQLFREIRNYAKRQVTYWKRNKEIQWQ
jgi:tRNA dimethylallyltransferase